MKQLLAIALVLGVLTQAAHANPQYMTAYHQLEQRLGAPKNDPTTAFAVFMVGCYLAYTGAPVPADDKFKSLRGHLAGHASTLIEQAGANRKQTIEYLATTGMSLVVRRMALDRKPDARAKAALRAQAETVLAQMKVDPTTLVQGFAKFLEPDANAPAPVADRPQAPSPQVTPPTTANARGPDLAALRRQTVGVVTSYDSSYDGEYIEYVQHFHLLLKSGWATRELEAALEPGGPDAHRARNPKAWLRWRRKGKGFELCDKQCDDPRNWGPITSRLSGPFLDPLRRKGHRFAGSFKSVSGGSVGDTTALNYGFWTFEANGRFSTSSAGSVSVNSWRPSTGNRQIASSGRTSETVGGTYEVDGIVLTLKFDDGRVVHRIIDVDEKPRPGSVTIDGKMYTRM